MGLLLWHRGLRTGRMVRSTVHDSVVKELSGLAADIIQIELSYQPTSALKQSREQ